MSAGDQTNSSLIVVATAHSLVTDAKRHGDCVCTVSFEKSCCSIKPVKLEQQPRVAPMAPTLAQRRHVKSRRHVVRRRHDSEMIRHDDSNIARVRHLAEPLRHGGEQARALRPTAIIQQRLATHMRSNAVDDNNADIERAHQVRQRVKKRGQVDKRVRTNEVNSGQNLIASRHFQQMRIASRRAQRLQMRRQRVSHLTQSARVDGALGVNNERTGRDAVEASRNARVESDLHGECALSGAALAAQLHGLARCYAVVKQRVESRTKRHDARLCVRAMHESERGLRIFQPVNDDFLVVRRGRTWNCGTV